MSPPDTERDPAEGLLHVSALDQYLYCPRRYWYYRFYDPQDISPAISDGTRLHDRQHTTPDWLREQYFASDDLGLHGKVDLVDWDSDAPRPVERKRGSSKSYYWNDEVQLAGYCMLIEDAVADVEEVPQGVIYLYSTDERHTVTITSDHRTAVRETITAIQSLSPDDPPRVVDNRAKCRACSVKHLCQPATETHLRTSHSGPSQPDYE